MVFLDPSYQQHVPNLDGGEGASQHILFGTNVDWHTETTTTTTSEGEQNFIDCTHSKLYSVRADFFFIGRASSNASPKSKI